MPDEQTDADLEALRAALLTEEEMPLGMGARLEAAVARAAAAQDPPWSARIVVAAVAFIAIGMAAGDRLDAMDLLLAVCGALAYVWAFAAVLRGRSRTE